MPGGEEVSGRFKTRHPVRGAARSGALQTRDLVRHEIRDQRRVISCRAASGMTAFVGVVLTLLIASAFAQQAENPIPASGGALIMPKDALPDPLAAGWRGEKVCELLQENEKLRALRCAFPPGVGHERHFHPPHFGYVLAGGKMTA